MSRIVTATFVPGSRYEQVKNALWQYDYGVTLRLQGLELPAAVEVHFATVERGGESETRIGVTTDGVTEVKIPNALLELDRTQDYNIYAFVYLADETSGHTEYKICMTVRSRPKTGKPSQDEDKEHPFDDAVKAVSAAADRAETAAEEAADSASAAKAAAETTGRDLEEVKKTAVEAIEAVEKAKKHVDQTIEQFDRHVSETEQETLTAIGNAAEEAKTAGVKAIDDAKFAGIKAVDDTKTSGVQAVKDAQTAAVGAVTKTQTDAETAIDNAKTSGVAAVEQAKNDGMSAVEQAVEEGKLNFVTDATLTESGRAADAKATGEAIGSLKKRQNILIGTETWNPIVVSDAFEAPLCGLTIYGRSEQMTTTGAQLLGIPDYTGISRGVTITVKEGLISLHGTCTEDGWVLIEQVTPVSLDGVYILSVYGADLRATLVTEKYSAIMTSGSASTVNNRIAKRAAFIVKKGKVLNVDGIKLMLNAGYTALPWEPYTGGKPSPSPDYPQEIVSAGDDGNLSVIVKNPDNEQMQSVSFSTPNGLPGIPVTSGGNYTDENGKQWVCDEVDLGRGVYVQRVKGAFDATKALTEQSVILATPIENPLTTAEIAAYKALTTYGPTTVVETTDGAGLKLSYQQDVNIVIKQLQDALASITTKEA